MFGLNKSAHFLNGTKTVKNFELRQTWNITLHIFIVLRCIAWYISSISFEEDKQGSIEIET